MEGTLGRHVGHEVPVPGYEPRILPPPNRHSEDRTRRFHEPKGNRSLASPFMGRWPAKRVGGATTLSGPKLVGQVRSQADTLVSKALDGNLEIQHNSVSS